MKVTGLRCISTIGLGTITVMTAVRVTVRLMVVFSTLTFAYTFVNITRKRMETTVATGAWGPMPIIVAITKFLRICALGIAITSVALIRGGI
ncbi:hypothetical protein POJ06DRAFT_252435 [Lipomyces tetrasporus]|uniref:Uncharacterized protein n=1 Tax=Lipomyces tetrasporus TaxID=54092 RepID=A0AAD7QRZ5_9ASCO|nr:uncharacterized protein POJ06DRAFT_252435 [Lipomyces tetrasporus]KAJ8100355.1 hypothetical protein POJ06DRAFT_252435 [Lipomyces tetrasporus]